MAKAFVSYSRSTASALDSLVSDLEGLGHDVWADRELTGGQAWWTQILEQIRECELFIFLLSPDSLESVACKRELSYAIALRKPVLPILVADGVALGLLPETLSSVQHVDYRQPDRTTVLSLSRAVRAVRPAAALPEPLPTPPEIPISYLGSLATRIEIEQLLTFEQQSAILVDLRRALRDPNLRVDARQLLPKLRARRDLLSTVAEEIDELTTNFAHTVTTDAVQPAPASTSTSTSTPTPTPTPTPTDDTKPTAAASAPSVAPPKPGTDEPWKAQPAILTGTSEGTAISRRFPRWTLWLVPAVLVIAAVLLSIKSAQREEPVPLTVAASAAENKDSTDDPAKLNALADHYSELHDPKSDEEAVRLWRASANKGNSIGQANLGMMYEQGRGGLPQSDAEAVKLYRLAADQGVAAGQANLGRFHEQGRGGLPQSDSEAVKLYRAAADQGLASGQTSLGRLYELGRGGLPQSDAEAVKLYRLAADKGNVVAQANLGVLYEQGRGGLPKSDAEAVKLYRLAADQGVAAGQTNLGRFHELGRGGLPKSDSEAVKLYRAAADQGLASGQTNLGRLYEQGRGGLPKSDAEAAKLYRAAADQGDATGQAFLGDMYERGVGGVRQDRSEAVRLYQLARKQGNDFATQALQRLGES